jgi:hypothetical protein
LISLAIIAGYIIIIIFNINIPVINPVNQQNTLPLLVSGHLLPIQPNSLPPVDYMTVIYLRYNGILVAGNKVTASAIVYLESPLAQNLTSASIFFPQSITYPIGNLTNGMPNDNTAMRLYNNGTGEIVGNTVSICFPSSGNFDFYSVYSNGSSTGVYEQISDPLTVNVAPISDLLTEKFNQTTLGLSLALVYFAFIEAFFLYLNHKKEKTNSPEKILKEFESLNQKLDKLIQKNIQKSPKNQKTQAHETDNDSNN